MIAGHLNFCQSEQWHHFDFCLDVATLIERRGQHHLEDIFLVVWGEEIDQVSSIRAFGAWEYFRAFARKWRLFQSAAVFK